MKMRAKNSNNDKKVESREMNHLRRRRRRRYGAHWCINLQRLRLVRYATVHIHHKVCATHHIHNVAYCMDFSRVSDAESVNTSINRVYLIESSFFRWNVISCIFVCIQCGIDCQWKSYVCICTRSPDCICLFVWLFFFLSIFLYLFFLLIRMIHIEFQQ